MLSGFLCSSQVSIIMEENLNKIEDVLDSLPEAKRDWAYRILYGKSPKYVETYQIKKVSLVSVFCSRLFHLHIIVLFLYFRDLTLEIPPTAQSIAEKHNFELQSFQFSAAKEFTRAPRIVRVGLIQSSSKQTFEISTDGFLEYTDSYRNPANLMLRLLIYCFFLAPWIAVILVFTL